ncbi:hypothetical protein K502DRAFT_325737 [Neoconidiobolus thromboides FSU 785]|nr:hypothetical protein K502DRAFT_325737 [Neoconidiobolus thromboides FSU 785]
MLGTSSSTGGYQPLNKSEDDYSSEKNIFRDNGEFDNVNNNTNEEEEDQNESYELPPSFESVLKEKEAYKKNTIKRKLLTLFTIFFSIGLFLFLFGIPYLPNFIQAYFEDLGGRYQAPTLLYTGKRGAVATENEICSKIGTQTLREGGNAVDSAIASAFCIGVVNSFSSGIGGGGFMTIRTKDGKYDFIDFREEAPAATTFEEYLKQPNRTQFGGTAVGVPGEIKGFELAHQRYGNLKWRQLIEPSIKLARSGFPVGKQLAYYLKSNKQYIDASTGFREVFINQKDELAKEGDIVYRKNLADTLEIIAKEGSDGFYKGKIAEKIIQTIQKEGGVMTLKDLQEYRPITRKPMVGTFLGNKVITSPPPTSGPILLSILNILEGYKLSDITAHDEITLYYHRLIESFKFGYAQRTELADPIMPNITQKANEFADKLTAQNIRRNISDTHTYDYKYYHPKYSHKELPGTTHLSVIDSDKMAVGLTSTVNLIFGSKIMDEETGVIFNNQIDDFSIPHTKNGFDLFPSPANFIAPRKRPLSSTVPTIIEANSDSDDLELLVLGGSGGSRILTAAVQVILQVVINKKEVHRAIDHPRLHNQLLPELTYFEPKFCPMISNSLEKYKHNIEYLSFPNSVIQAVHYSKGVYSAASDGRKHGLADAY